jgi:hypothetical protein
MGLEQRNDLMAATWLKPDGTAVELLNEAGA